MSSWLRNSYSSVQVPVVPGSRIRVISERVSEGKKCHTGVKEAYLKVFCGICDGDGCLAKHCEIASQLYVWPMVQLSDDGFSRVFVPLCLIFTDVCSLMRLPRCTYRTTFDNTFCFF